MDQITDFETFYTLRLSAEVEELRQQAHATRHWKTMVYISVPAFLIYLFIFIIKPELQNSGVFPLFMVGLIAIVSITFFTTTKDNYQAEFKEKIIKKILEFIHPGITYKPNSFMSSRHFRASALIRSRYASINGDDYFAGVYKQVAFRCSELTVSGDDSSIFLGLFFAARIGAYYNGGTYVWSSKNHQYAESVFTKHYRYFPMPEVTRMQLHDPLFDKYFTVCSTSPQQARSILTDYRREQMIKFCTLINADISFSFVAGECYVVIPSGKGMFEAGKDPGDKEQLKQYFKNILLFLSLIEKLALDEMQ